MRSNLLSYFGYAMFTLVAFFILRLAIPTGDHQFGTAHAFGIVLFLAIFIFVFLIALCRSFYRIYKKMGQFSWYPVVVFSITTILTMLAYGSEHRKFWTSVYLEGSTDFEQFKNDGALALFNNGTFEASEIHTDYGSVFAGNYILKNNILTLDRADLTEKSDSTFCVRYSLDSISKRFIPLQKGFSDIIIEKKVKK
jgi:hypothetical protein